MLTGRTTNDTPNAEQNKHATASIAVRLNIPCAFSLFLKVLSTLTLQDAVHPPSFAIHVNIHVPMPVALITVFPSSCFSTIV